MQLYVINTQTKRSHHYAAHCQEVDRTELLMWRRNVKVAGTGPGPFLVGLTLSAISCCPRWRSGKDCPKWNVGSRICRKIGLTYTGHSTCTSQWWQTGNSIDRACRLYVPGSTNGGGLILSIGRWFFLFSRNFAAQAWAHRHPDKLHFLNAVNQTDYIVIPRGSFARCEHMVGSSAPSPLGSKILFARFQIAPEKNLLQVVYNVFLLKSTSIQWKLR